MSFPHVARQGFITESALPSITRARGTSSTDALFLFNSTGTTATFAQMTVIDESNTISASGFTYFNYPSKIDISLATGSTSSFVTNNQLGGGAIRVNNTTSMGLTTNTDYTLECFVKLGESFSGMGDRILFDFRGGPVAQNLYFGLTGNNGLTPFYNDGTSKSTSFPLNTTQTFHLAWVRSGGTITQYVNGTARGTPTASAVGSTSSQFTLLADQNFGTRVFLGMVSNIRLSKHAVYTTNFTPPTSVLGVTTGTVLLLNGLGNNYTYPGNSITDASTASVQIVPQGKPQVTDFSPYASGGKSVFFSQANEGLIAPNDRFFFGANNLTYEFWLYPTVSSGNSSIVGIWSAAASSSWNIERSGTTGVLTANFVASGGNVSLTNAAAVAAVNTWTHVAVARNGNVWSLYTNGVQRATTTVSRTVAGLSNTPLAVQINPANTIGQNPTDVYICDLHIMNGTAKYTTTPFAVPTSPITTTTNTVFLFNLGADYTDTTGSAPFAAIVGSNTSTNVVRLDNAVTKFGATSVFQSGTATNSVQGFRIPGATNNTSFNLNGDFTIEGWVYPTTFGVGAQLLGFSDNFAIGNYFFGYTSAGALNFTNSLVSSNNVISLNTWSHIAVTRFGPELSLYANGSRVAVTTTATAAYPMSATLELSMGTDNGGNARTIQGYYDHIRMLPFAVYTGATYTVPTSAPTKLTTYVVNSTNAIYGTYQEF